MAWSVALAIVEEAVFAEYRLAFRRGDEVDELAGQRRNAVQLALNGIFVYCIRHCKH